MVSPTNAPRLLVVDDNDLHRRGLSRFLRQAGYAVDEQADAVGALKNLVDEVYDGVLTDISMPDVDGLELLREIRKRDLEVPVVLVTGRPALETAVRAMEYGANHYLIKPAEPGEVLRVVKQMVQLGRIARVRREAEALVRNSPAPFDRDALNGSFNQVLDTLWMAYQPIIRASDNGIAGFEALLRSDIPELPHPGAVLDAAERLGRLRELGRVVRERATMPFLEHQRQELLFVNLHANDLTDLALKVPNAPLSQIASQVVLEITERASLDHVGDVRSHVTELRSLGFRIAIDDIGAGYAGLSSFALLEPEIVKLDMSLVRGIDTQPTKQRVVKSLKELCRDMGILVVAEGVETPVEHRVLLDLGCDLFQGFLFARPARPFPTVAPVTPLARSGTDP